MKPEEGGESGLAYCQFPGCRYTWERPYSLDSCDEIKSIDNFGLYLLYL
jgi:hypothetical protein